MLLMAVADDSAIRYVLPVLLMTSFFRITVATKWVKITAAILRRSHSQVLARLFTVIRQVAAPCRRGEVCCRRLVPRRGDVCLGVYRSAARRRDAVPDVHDSDDDRVRHGALHRLSPVRRQRQVWVLVHSRSAQHRRTLPRRLSAVHGLFSVDLFILTL